MAPVEHNHQMAPVVLPPRVIFSGVRIRLGTILGRFSIIYFRGLGLRIRVRVWVGVRVRVRVWVRVSVGVRVVNMFGVMVMVRVNSTQNLNPDP